MRPIILYRTPDMSSDELECAAKEFVTTPSRMNIQKDDLVIGRYSVLPYYREQARDIELAGARLINTTEQHEYIVDIGQWYEDLKGLTPETWSDPALIPSNGSFVLKGQTNSRKFLWDTHMFAKDRTSVGQVLCRLQDDTMIGYQKIYVRRYVPLRQLMVGLHDLPVSNEFRFFVCNGKVLSSGFYWSSHVGDLSSVPDPREVPTELLDRVIQRVGDRATFYVVDVAQKEDGSWIVIELNDGQMSGLSENKPEVLYKELRKILPH